MVEYACICGVILGCTSAFVSFSDELVDGAEYAACRVRYSSEEHVDCGLDDETPNPSPLLPYEDFAAQPLAPHGRQAPVVTVSPEDEEQIWFLHPRRGAIAMRLPEGADPMEFALKVGMPIAPPHLVATAIDPRHLSSGDWSAHPSWIDNLRRLYGDGIGEAFQDGEKAKELADALKARGRSLPETVLYSALVAAGLGGLLDGLPGIETRSLSPVPLGDGDEVQLSLLNAAGGGFQCLDIDGERVGCAVPGEGSSELRSVHTDQMLGTVHREADGKLVTLFDTQALYREVSAAQARQMGGLSEITKPGKLGRINDVVYRGVEGDTEIIIREGADGRWTQEVRRNGELVSGAFRPELRMPVDMLRSITGRDDLIVNDGMASIDCVVNAAGDVTCGPRVTCFAAGTPILTASGPRPIESIVEGELVLAGDPATGTHRWRRVVRRFETADRPLWRLTLVRRGTEEPSEEALEATAEHPFFVKGRGWRSLQALHVGDRLIASEGEVEVRAVEETGRLATVFNLEVEEFHTYFVGQLGVLAHNECDGPERIGDPNLTPEQIDVAMRMWRAGYWGPPWPGYYAVKEFKVGGESYARSYGPYATRDEAERSVRGTTRVPQLPGQSMGNVRGFTDGQVVNRKDVEEGIAEVPVFNGNGYVVRVPGDISTGVVPPSPPLATPDQIEAIEFVREALANGPLLVSELNKRGAARGIGKARISAARQALGVDTSGAGPRVVVSLSHPGPAQRAESEGQAGGIADPVPTPETSPEAFVRAQLADGPLRARELSQRARAAGITPGDLAAARRAVGVTSTGRGGLLTYSLPGAPTVRRPTPEEAATQAFVREQLANGPLNARELSQRAQAAGISSEDLASARQALGVVRVGLGGAVTYALPGDENLASRSSPTRLQEAVEFLADALADGPVAHAELVRAAQELGITRHFLTQAAQQLQVVRPGRSGGPGADGSWRLPN